MLKMALAFVPESETSLSGTGDRISHCRFKNGGQERRYRLAL
jgi:hypothetical protein